MQLARPMWMTVLLAALTADQPAVAETVALRTAAGRFLRAADDGTLHADRLYPGPNEKFVLDPVGKDRITLKAANGKYLWAADYWGRLWRADSPQGQPGGRETFEILPVEGNRVALRLAGCQVLVVIDPSAANSPASLPPAPPRAEETVEIFRAGDVPAAIQALLVTIIQSMLAEELGGKEYAQTRMRKIERYIDVPSPSLRDLTHTRRQRILATEEQYEIKARLDGPLDLKVPGMPYLRGYRDSGVGVLLFVVEATVTLRGEVHFKMPKVVSAGTGYCAVAKLSLVAELRAQKSGDQFSLQAPEVRDIQIKVDLRDISNDVLNVAREQIEDLVNRELRHNEARIRQQANDSLRKAAAAHEFRSPLLKYLLLP